MVSISKRLLCLFWLSSGGIEIDARPQKESSAIYGRVVDLRVERRNVNDSEVVGVALSFRMRVRNDDAQAIELGSSCFMTTGVQFRPRGSVRWIQLTNSSLLYDDSIDCSVCASIAPGAIHEVKRVESEIVTLKRLWPDQSTVEFRLQLEGVCRRAGSGQIKREVLFTEPFQFELEKRKADGSTHRQ
jgi:hypothetical protein